jgi:hypothetical protein
MYQDARLLFAGAIDGTTNAITGQTITGTGVTVLSTNVVDLSQNRDIGEGEDIFGRFAISTAVVGGTSVEFQVVTADDAAITTNVTVLATTSAVAIAGLTLGTLLVVELPPRIASRGQRYLAMRYITVGAVTGGTFIGDLGIEIQDGKKFYPSGFAVI